MKIALAQMFCPWGETERNIALIGEFCRRARHGGAQMAMFPELTVSGIYKDKKVCQFAESLDGPAVRRVCYIARQEELFVGFGLTEKAQPLPYNAYCIVSPYGRLIGTYRKNYIPKLEVPFWQGHNERPVFSVNGKQFAVAICWDNTQPELLAEYGRNKVEVVLMPHAWDADPLDSHGKELKYESMAELAELHRNGHLRDWKSHDAMRDHFYSYIPQRAKDNGFYALFVNQSGQPHDSLRFVGPSFAVSPQGEILAATKNGDEHILYVDIE